MATRKRKNQLAKKQVKIQVGQGSEGAAWEKLFILRDTTRRTGILHEPQVQNLKMWPLVFLSAKSVTCSFSWEDRSVVFDVDVGKRPSKFKSRMEYLVQATQKLLGDEYSVYININGKQEYHGQATEV